MWKNRGSEEGREGEREKLSFASKGLHSTHHPHHTYQIVLYSIARKDKARQLCPRLIRKIIRFPSIDMVRRHIVFARAEFKQQIGILREAPHGDSSDLPRGTEETLMLGEHESTTPTVGRAEKSTTFASIGFESTPWVCAEIFVLGEFHAEVEAEHVLGFVVVDVTSEEIVERFGGTAGFLPCESVDVGPFVQDGEVGGR